MTESHAGRGEPQRRTLLIGVILIGALSCVLRLWPIDHGAPHPEYVPDTHVVRNALHMLGDRDLVPPANAYSSYPYLLPYVLLPVYAADFAWGYLQGDWSSGEEYGRLLKEVPWHAHLLARIVLALIAASAPLFILMAARAAGMRAGAWIAAVLCATSLLHLQLSVQERPWAPMAAAIAATAWGAAVHTRAGSRRSLLWTSVAAAVAFSMHQAGGLALGIVGLAWLLAPDPERAAGAEVERGEAIKRKLLRGAGAVGLFWAVSLAVGHPYLVRFGLEADVAAQELVRDDQTQVTFGAQQVVLGLRGATFVGLFRSFMGYDPVLLLAGLAGMVMALRRRALVPSMVFVLGWGAFFMTNQNEHIRYLLPMAVLMSLPAGLLLERLIRHPLGAAATGLALALPLLQAARLDWLLAQEDTRTLAAAMLQELPPGSRVAIDVYGPVVPQSLAALETTASLREATGSALYGREEHRRMMLEAGLPQAPGLDAIRLEDVFEYDLRHGGTWVREGLTAAHGATTAEVLASLGISHLLLVDRTPEDGTPPPLVDPAPSRPLEGAAPGSPPVPKLAPLELSAEVTWQVHPSWTQPTTSVDGEAVDAHLPTAMPFPLRDLWSVRRAGPKLQLHVLPPR
ncbi:MAG: hypothetical protein P8M11_16825 [Planctomycetota bacterium]|nr:hypothetical protein [Planctomycetota bacterium]MDG1986219.1 hypothetical protein [Planctomycetota bacterium]